MTNRQPSDGVIFPEPESRAFRVQWSLPRGDFEASFLVIRRMLVRAFDNPGTALLTDSY